MNAHAVSGIGTVTVADVQAVMGKAGTALIDCRLPFDYFGGRIPGSINLPAQLVQERVQELGASTRLIFICDDGEASAESAQSALDAGFTDVALLEGGLDAWLDADLPIETISDGTSPPPSAGA